MSQGPQLTTLNQESMEDQSQRWENSSLVKAADWLRAPSAGKGNYPLLPERSLMLLGCVFPLSVSGSRSKSKVQSSEEGREDLGQEDIWEEQQGVGASLGCWQLTNSHCAFEGLLSSFISSK